MKHTHNEKIFKLKKLSIYVGCILGGFSVTTTVLSELPGDLNIYKQPTLGRTNLILMIDSTAGMDDAQSGKPVRSIAKDYPACANINLATESVTSLDSKYQSSYTLKDSRGNIKPTFVYPMPYCRDNTSEYKYSRMDRMKVAMTKLLSSDDISDSVNMGMGQFSTQTSKQYILDSSRTAQNNNTGSVSGVTQYYYTLNDAYLGLGGGTGVSSKILLPAVPLTLEQRWKMRVAVNALNSGSRTPLAAALAESGAYMLGHTTKNSDGTSPGSNIITGQSQLNGSTRRTVTKFSASGFDDSIDSAKNGTNYNSPIANDSASCNSNGIFLLTNAAPSQTPKTVAQSLMQNALADGTFQCPTDNTNGVMKTVGSGSTDYGWTCMAEFAHKLKISDKKVKVAVAGFGNNFSPYLDPRFSKLISDENGKQRKYYKCNDLTVGQTYVVNGISTTVTQDTINACNLGEKANSEQSFNTNGKVGGYGEGGFYPILSPDDLIKSIKNFVADLQTGIPSLNSGIPGIPIDTLNSTQQLPYAYYSQFQPNTTSSQAVGIWLGNIKKYKVTNNTFQDKNSDPVIHATTGNLNSTTDFWSTSADNADATKGGALAKIPVQTASGRKIYINRSVTGNTATEITTSGSNLKLVDSKNTTDSTQTAEALRASNDIDQTNAYLLNLLGFAVMTPTVPSTLDGVAELRQMGATINSTPLMFTTQSKIATKNSGSGASLVNIGDYIDRKDYILFGTNQGLLQVLDATTGAEKFAFLPNEMIQNQKKGFISKSLQTGSDYSDLYQGIDGAWSAYATYETNDVSNSLKASNLNVYGGLRRGGSNYYGLDLKNIETSTPKLLFKTGPAFNATGQQENCSNTSPLNCMGQSWSKPAIAFVKWKGKPQLVMIVGGGYDTVFNTPSYKANTAVTKGNGVYMFAANTNANTGLTAGDLMWWGSSTATTTVPGADNNTQKTSQENLKYSVVSEIKTVDRDSDGFVDNLYFGDLGGQIFRVDINNVSSSSTANFNVKRIVRLANFINDTERATKTAPRFYTLPTFTVHSTGNLEGMSHATRYGVISIGSGDVSSPVVNDLNATSGIPDRIYGIFDRDIGRTDLYSIGDDSSITDGLRTGTISTANMLDIAVTSGNNAATLVNMLLATTKGWYSTLNGATFGTTSATEYDANLVSGIARYKVLSNFSAIDHTLFTSYFDSADNGSFSSCSAGIKGRSYIKNYCLPFGSMNAKGTACGTAADGRGFSGATTMGSNVGAGIIPVIIGGMSTSSGISIGPITGKGVTSDVKAQYQTPLRLDPMKWSEKIVKDAS